MKKRKAKFIYLLAPVISFFIFMCVLELGMRVYTSVNIFYDIEMTRYANTLKVMSKNPKIGHTHKPNSSEKLMGELVKINSYGLRDREYDLKRAPETFRIAVLGDSLTFGWGVKKEHTFEEILEIKLNDKSKENIELINFAAGNYNTEQQVNVFLEKGIQFNPNKVVVFYFLNDAEITPKKSNLEFLGHSYGVTFIWSRLNAILAKYSSGKNSTYKGFYSSLYRDNFSGFIAMKAAFKTLRDTCESKGIELQTILLPELHDLKNYPFKSEYDKVKKVLADLGIDYLDLSPYFKNEENPIKLWVALDDAHPNATAHKMIADYSLDFISKGIVEKAPSGEMVEK